MDTYRILEPDAAGPRETPRGENGKTSRRAGKSQLSGMLLYAATDEEIQPDNSYQMSGNKISVRTLNLNRDFSEIAAQLNAIVDEHFSGLSDHL